MPRREAGETPRTLQAISLTSATLPFTCALAWRESTRVSDGLSESLDLVCARRQDGSVL